MLEAEEDNKAVDEVLSGKKSVTKGKSSKSRALVDTAGSTQTPEAKKVGQNFVYY